MSSGFLSWLGFPDCSCSGGGGGGFDPSSNQTITGSWGFTLTTAWTDGVSGNNYDLTIGADELITSTLWTTASVDLANGSLLADFVADLGPAVSVSGVGVFRDAADTNDHNFVSGISNKADASAVNRFTHSRIDATGTLSATLEMEGISNPLTITETSTSSNRIVESSEDTSANDSVASFQAASDKSSGGSSARLTVENGASVVQASLQAEYDGGTVANILAIGLGDYANNAAAAAASVPVNGLYFTTATVSTADIAIGDEIMKRRK